MGLDTAHRGYRIRYSENEDVWTSYDAGDGISAPTLSKLKEKIDRLIAKSKDKTAVNCLVMVDRGYTSDMQIVVADAKVTGYVGPDIGSKNAYSSIEKEVKGHKFEAVYVGRSWGRDNEKAARRVTNMRDLLPIGPETDAAIAEANRLGEDVNAARRRHEAAVAAIHRMKLSDFEDLVRISGIDPTGGLGGEGA